MAVVVPWPEPPSPYEIADKLRGLPGRFWLDGSLSTGTDHPRSARWSYLSAEPEEVRTVNFGDAPYSVFDSMVETDDGSSPPFRCPHWVGYIAYDAAWSARAVTGIRTPAIHERGRVPVVRFGRYPWMVAIDHESECTWIVARDRAEAARVHARVHARVVGEAKTPPRIGPVRADTPDRHREAIEGALEAITAGEIYQVNLARQWRCTYTGDPLSLFSAMRGESPVPLGAFLEAEEHVVLSRSMERFLDWDPASGRVVTAPIKGTIGASESALADSLALSADPKERAEHTMIVDLMRNDLSRVAQTGTVKVERAFQVEPYRGLSHLVSTVSAQTREGLSPSELLAATFAPGSVTGTPKARAMELIEALEPRSRGVYTGAIGFIDRQGGLSLSVAIRTAELIGPDLTYFAGGGIVEASQIDREVAETELKAAVFLQALDRVAPSQTLRYHRTLP